MSIQIKISKRPVPYTKAIEYLEKRVNNIKSHKERELIWILEHPTTFTAGIRSDKNDIIDKKIKVISSKRGGKITLHNPGQKIIYFAINLNNRKKDIRAFITVIENCLIKFLKIYNINSKPDKNKIGIWVKNKKIAAIGIRITKWIAYHGCSININNNLSEYKKINPCGLENDKITSVANECNNSINNIDTNLRKIFAFHLENF